MEQPKIIDTLETYHTHDPIEDHPSSVPSCVRDGSLFSTMVKPKELLADHQQLEPIDCRNIVKSNMMSSMN